MVVDHSTMDIIGTCFSLLVLALRAWQERYRRKINASEYAMAARGKIKGNGLPRAFFMYSRVLLNPSFLPLQTPAMQASDRNILNCGYIYPIVFPWEKGFDLGKKKTAGPLLCSITVGQ